MKVTTKVDKRYKPIDARPNWVRSDIYELDAKRVLTGPTESSTGTYVTVKGQRGAKFQFMYAERNAETGSIALAFVGGREGHTLTRAFRPEQINKVLKSRGG